MGKWSGVRTISGDNDWARKNVLDAFADLSGRLGNFFSGEKRYSSDGSPTSVPFQDVIPPPNDVEKALLMDECLSNPPVMTLEEDSFAGRVTRGARKVIRIIVDSGTRSHVVPGSQYLDAGTNYKDPTRVMVVESMQPHAERLH